MYEFPASTDLVDTQVASPSLTGQSLRYAMKSCFKKHVKKNNGRKLCDNEHLALKQLDSPYTVNLKSRFLASDIHTHPSERRPCRYAFMTKDELVLIMDLCMGGDLRRALRVANSR